MATTGLNGRRLPAVRLQRKVEGVQLGAFCPCFVSFPSPECTPAGANAEHHSHSLDGRARVQDRTVMAATQANREKGQGFDAECRGCPACEDCTMCRLPTLLLQCCGYDVLPGPDHSLGSCPSVRLALPRQLVARSILLSDFDLGI